ncbi:hypothetical protein [Streptomyces sp. NBC_01171]|nr:hypothetical protein OG448_30280 [Streptomyces sp. NBC_01171]
MGTHCPELDALTRPVRSFAAMLTRRQVIASAVGTKLVTPIVEWFED